MRNTKIVCTMGPATDDDEIVKKLILEGMSVARFNFSHGSHEEQKTRIDRVKRIRKQLDKPVALMLDTKGPEIRTGCFKDNKIALKAGETFSLCCGEEFLGDNKKCWVTYADMYKDVKPGGHILIDDGLVCLEIKAVKGMDVECVVINDGVISNHKGINIPDTHISLPFMSEKDMEDLKFGIEQDIDFVAASFTRTADDIKQMKWFMEANGNKDIKVIAKIENREGVENIDSIVAVADGVMVARGDMGVEIPEEEVPIVQKKLIKTVYQAHKPVITATQMLDSMIHNPRPTRAEITDVANAVYDGTSAIMLSGETAAGAFPVEAVKVMAKIAARAEQDINYEKNFYKRDREDKTDITTAICHATCTTAYDIKAAAVMTVTKSGASARVLSGFRPGRSIIAGTTSEKVCRQLALSWGVVPVLLDEKNETFSLFAHAIERAKEKEYLKDEDIVVITSGIPLGRSGTTNMIKVTVVGEE